MTKPLYIISSCTIADCEAFKNNEAFFSAADTSLQDFLLQLYHYLHADYPKFYKMDTLSKLGWLSSEILLKDEPIKQAYQPGEVALVISNANASLDTDLKYYQTVETASPSLFVYTLANILIGEICIRNNFKGEHACFISEEFNASLIQQQVTDLFENHNIKLCICGWVDVLEEDYKAALFLVSGNKAGRAVLFTEETMNTIFKAGK